MPRSLAELRIWLVGSSELASSLGPLCKVDSPRSVDWRMDAQSQAPAFLLVEAADGVEEEWGDELDGLLDDCERAGVPRLLWIATAPLTPHWLKLSARFDRVFTVDGCQVAELEAAGATSPSVLWPATALPVDERLATVADERQDRVVWLGGWNGDWPQAWRERLASVLRGAAAYGLRIAAIADTEGLPADLARCVTAPTPDEDPHTVLRGAKVIVAADPVHGSATLAPSVVFDAAASGAAVITPHDFASLHDFAVGGTKDAQWRNLVPVVHDEDVTTGEIDRLLEDELLREEVVSHLRRIVANNHTYAHRLATLASVAGYRLVPDAYDPAPA